MFYSPEDLFCHRYFIFFSQLTEYHREKDDAKHVFLAWKSFFCMYTSFSWTHKCCPDSRKMSITILNCLICSAVCLSERLFIKSCYLAFLEFWYLGYLFYGSTAGKIQNIMHFKVCAKFDWLRSGIWQLYAVINQFHVSPRIAGATHMINRNDGFISAGHLFPSIFTLSIFFSMI